MDRYQPIGNSADITNNIQGIITKSLVTITLGSLTSCSAVGNSYNYTIYGLYDPLDTYIVSIIHPGISDPNWSMYRVRIRYWVLTMDNWDDSS
jgi:hypothetical protein